MKREGWHFCAADLRLGWQDGRKIVVGETLTVEGSPRVCHHGLHALCVGNPLVDALEWAAGPIICRVLLGGKLDYDFDREKFCATERTVLQMLTLEQSIACLRGFLVRVIIANASPENRRRVRRLVKLWLSGEATLEEVQKLETCVGSRFWGACERAKQEDFSPKRLLLATWVSQGLSRTRLNRWFLAALHKAMKEARADAPAVPV